MIRIILGILLTLLSIYTLSESHLSLFGYINSLLDNKVSETNFASSLIIISKSLKTLSFLGLFYYGFSTLLNVKLNYTDKRWMYLLIFSVSMFLLELIGWALPLKPIEGFESNFTFLDNFIEVITTSIKVYPYHYISYGLFYGLFRVNR